MKKVVEFMLPKKFFVAVSTLALLFLVSSCSGDSVSNEGKIKEDLISYSSNYFTTSETIDKVEILKRQTSKDAGTDFVWCKVESSDSGTAYVKYVLLNYTLYDKGGWISLLIFPLPLRKFASEY